MEVSTIKNDKDFDVTVTYKDDDEDKEVVVKAGEEVEVPTEVAEDVTTQIAEATAPEADEDENKDEDSKDEDSNEDENKDDDSKEEESEDEEEDKDKQLSKALLRNSELSIEKRYSELLSAGKVTPAMKDKILGLAKLEQGVSLSTEAGKKVSLSSIVFDILEAGDKKFSTEEKGSGKENEEENNDDDSSQNSDDKKPSESLSEAELAGFKAVGADPAKMDELAEKDPVFREALKTLSKKYDKKG